MRFVVLFDACVFYPAPLRDFLLRLANSGLFAAKWTEHIHKEWITNLLTNRPDLKAAQLDRTRMLMNEAVPDCLVTEYESLIEGLKLPDENDKHVLAAAIRCGAQVIVTFNLKDFPQEILDAYGIEAMHPDLFIEHQMSLHQGKVIGVAKSHRAALQNPPKSAEEYLATLAAQRLIVTADKLREFVELI